MTFFKWLKGILTGDIAMVGVVQGLTRRSDKSLKMFKKVVDDLEDTNLKLQDTKQKINDKLAKEILVYEAKVAALNSSTGDIQKVMGINSNRIAKMNDYLNPIEEIDIVEVK